MLDSGLILSLSAIAVCDAKVATSDAVASSASTASVAGLAD